MKKRITLKKMIFLAVLIALNIVITRFLSISTPIFRISFTFLTIVCPAILFGPVEAAIVGGLGDLLGALLFPSGPFFPGFTLTAVLTGLVFGFFLHKKQTILRIVLSSAIVEFILGLLLNTLWIHLLYGKAFLAILPTRLIQAVGMFVVQVLLIFFVNEVLFKRVRSIVKEGRE